jgi:hypothetical protein
MSLEDASRIKAGVKALIMTGIISLTTANGALGSQTMGLDFVEVEYCALVEANTCVPLVADVRATLSRNQIPAADPAMIVEVAMTAALDAGRTVCSTDGLVCVSLRPSRANGELICIGITIDAARLPEGILGHFVVIRVGFDPADPDCSPMEAATVTLDTSCLGPLAMGDFIPVGDRGFFHVLGVRPPNCGQPISTEPSSWGAIKALYR